MRGDKKKNSKVLENQREVRKRVRGKILAKAYQTKVGALLEGLR